MLNLSVGDIVVYAAHGIGRIEARRPRGGDLPEMVVILFPNDLRVTLPLSRAQKTLRSLSGEPELDDVTRTLRANPEPPHQPWSKHYSLTRDKVDAGEVKGLAEVIRDGHERQQLAATSSASATTARALYLRARKLLSEEIALARGIDPDAADAWIVEQIDESRR